MNEYFGMMINEKFYHTCEGVPICAAGEREDGYV